MVPCLSSRPSSSSIFSSQVPCAPGTLGVELTVKVPSLSELLSCSVPQSLCLAGCPKRYRMKPSSITDTEDIYLVQESRGRKTGKQHVNKLSSCANTFHPPSSPPSTTSTIVSTAQNLERLSTEDLSLFIVSTASSVPTIVSRPRASWHRRVRGSASWQHGSMAVR